ncbi:hypothetical protein [Embleya sp. NPDC059259]|uniref:DNA polymerase III subunit beta family protein n=1 Tax=unclassified Embleya TaxID=2699296 RepID=UPI003692702D
MTEIPDFRDLIQDVTPHMGKDETLPMLCGIRVEADDHHLYLVATDRYTLAVTRRVAPGIGTWTTFLDLDDVKAITALGRIARLRRIDLEHDGRHLTARVGTHALTLDTKDVEGVPSWRPLVREALAAKPQDAPQIVLNARMLARWGHHLRWGAEPLLMWATGPRTPLVIVRGEDFVGLHMPVRVSLPDEDERPRRDAARTAWTQALTAERPALAA